MTEFSDGQPVKKIEARLEDLTSHLEEKLVGKHCLIWHQNKYEMNKIIKGQKRKATV